MPREDKVSEALKQEISNIILSELRDPRIGFITVTRVELTHDLRYARVFFSVLGKDEEYEKTKKALDSASGFIRRLIAQRIRLRFAPEISFKEDRSVEYSIQIQKALEEVKKLSPPEASLAKVAKPRKKRVVKSEPKRSSRLRKKA